MHFHVITLFPEMVSDWARHGVFGRAVDTGRLELSVGNPREFATDIHRTVDDRPYGGGPGMVMKVGPLRRAIAAGVAQMPAGSPVIYLSPQGERLTQSVARKLAKMPGLVLLAGRYEGIDERLIEADIDQELSLGDFVLSGGELAAMVVADCVARLVPGVLGDAASAQQDSFSEGLLEYPHYTRPEELDGQNVPPVLLSGDHEAIRRWRLKSSLIRTWQRRPDLLDGMDLTSEQRELLDEFLAENKNSQSDLKLKR
ncbi:MAG: tRNA (guanosine(37)-N1)-methyltransferase TrmD [Gammaproteobacteria bacterium]|nr:tRNA (guanosine(37)-N1)-methyltransferase TrmD [Gammaproteobacteria bacterium]NNF68121.1 tRNA (guanosine(37)-N1)-methyltransferase TrmD [Gammaproteobacteria bacterium]